MKLFSRLKKDIRVVFERDPAARSVLEVLFCYSGLHAIWMHRVSHALYLRGWVLLPRLISNLCRFLTGIEIHPGATIGEGLFIDHGTGIVIGETAELGKNVTLYQGVTLGGTDPANGIGGKRHPTLCDDVIVGSGAQILGPVIVNPRARVGANAVVTKDVPEGAVMVGIPARSTLLDATEYARDFVPYGTPCSEAFDPATQKLEILQCQLEVLQKQLKALLEERAAPGEGDDAPRRKGGRKSA